MNEVKKAVEWLDIIEHLNIKGKTVYRMRNDAYIVLLSDNRGDFVNIVEVVEFFNLSVDKVINQNLDTIGRTNEIYLSLKAVEAKIAEGEKTVQDGEKCEKWFLGKYNMACAHYICWNKMGDFVPESEEFIIDACIYFHANDGVRFLNCQMAKKLYRFMKDTGRM
jgi:hypothetical protein